MKECSDYALTSASQVWKAAGEGDAGAKERLCEVCEAIIQRLRKGLSVLLTCPTGIEPTGIVCYLVLRRLEHSKASALTAIGNIRPTTREGLQMSLIDTAEERFAMFLATGASWAYQVGDVDAAVATTAVELQQRQHRERTEALGKALVPYEIKAEVRCPNSLIHVDPVLFTAGRCYIPHEG